MNQQAPVPPVTPVTPDDLERLLLGSDVRYTREEVSSATGVPLDVAREFWQALGYPDTGPVAAFTRCDIDALREGSRLVRSGMIDTDSMKQLMRGMGRMMSMLAEWQAETVAAMVEDIAGATVADGMDAADPTEDESGTSEQADRLRIAYELTDELLPAVEKLLVYSWRRKLALAAERIARVGDDGDGSLLSTRMTVGFADLESYTRLSTGLTARALSEFIEVFESTAHDVIVGGGGRVIKTMGDEVLFVTPCAQVGATIGTRLVEVIGANPTLPNIRVGLATGAVVTRQGDVFGVPANLASRLTGLAGRNVVLTDAATVAAFKDDTSFATRRLEPTNVRGIGIVEPYELRRPEPRGIPHPADRPVPIEPPSRNGDAFPAERIVPQV